MRQVPYVDFPAQFGDERAELMPIIEALFARGEFVGGTSVDRLEAALGKYLGVEHVVALNSGTDALILAMKVLGIGPGDEVITPPNSFVASTAAVVALGATPIFADVLEDQMIDPDAVRAAITPRTKAIMPVHLSGNMCDMEPLVELAERHGLAIIEDSAQAIGSLYRNQLSGTIGDAGCFSLHPLKNLNAAGDAGFLVLKDAQHARRARLLRNHGLIDRETVVEWGSVSRLDCLQAEILNYRLPKLDGVIEKRRAHAARYCELLRDVPVFIPAVRQDTFHTYHTFVIQTDHRNEMREFLAARGVGTAIHYPVPIHLQPAAEGLGYGHGAFPATERQATRILTLPVNQFLADDDVTYVADTIREFTSRSNG